jgi:hypothetical protein
MTENSSMMPTKKIRLVIMFLLVALFVLFLTQNFWKSNLPLANDQVVQVNSTPPDRSSSQTSSVGTPTRASALPVVGGTYQPSVARRLREIPRALEIGYKNPNWWLYARTQEDAAWLDRHGYPTPSEENRLTAATDEELKAMAQLGDINAKVHLASRSAKAEFNGSNLIKAEGASNMMALLAQEHGPYAALKAMTTFGEVKNLYNTVPETARTEYQKKVIREYSKAYEIAYAMTQAYGEHTAELVRSYTVAPQSFGAIDRKDAVAAEFAQSLANTSRDRIAKGLPPITLDPRPIPPEVTNGSLSYQQTTTVFERQ